MKHILLLAILMLQSSAALAFITDLFLDEDGNRNWQHLANWTGGSLLILLTIVTIYLLLARRRLHKVNLELTAIKKDLEQRVQERTATLNQSNKLLQESNKLLEESNKLLEEEVSRHVITSEQLQFSESYIKDILTSMPLMLVGLDRDGCITHWNKQVEEMSGISSDDALGKTLWQAYPKTTVLPEHVEQSIEHKKIIHLKQSLRSLYHYEITIYPLQEQEAGVVILIDDVTKQTAAENILIHNDKMSFMGELASTMAHDINLPLQAIMMDLRRFQRFIGGGQETEQKTPDVDQTEQLNSIIKDMSDKGKQVSSIISNLLAFARSRSGNKQKANIVDVMENTISLANEVISAPDGLSFDQIKLERHFKKNLPLLPCYITELQQVFLSLFRHACYALALKEDTEGFEPLINVYLTENYDNLWIKIQHNGLGLTADEQMNLFEPFFTDKSSAEGFDVVQHLSFSYYIVTEQHQGNMAVTSNVELGTTIHIQLPLRD
jgi:PAS domain S-box-containing protein